MACSNSINLLCIDLNSVILVQLYKKTENASFTSPKAFTTCIITPKVKAAVNKPGAIIKKGGLGLPLVLSVLIFLSYHYIGIFAKNAAEDNSINPILASWISTMILAPFAFYLTKRASSDEGFVNFDFITVPIQKIYSKYIWPKS